MNGLPPVGLIDFSVGDSGGVDRSHPEVNSDDLDPNRNRTRQLDVDGGLSVTDRARFSATYQCTPGTRRTARLSGRGTRSLAAAERAGGLG